MNSPRHPLVDIVIPVYNEGKNILTTLGTLSKQVTSPARVLLCYDMDSDDTLFAVRAHPECHEGLPVLFIKNRTRGAHGAIMAGLAASEAPYVIVSPADDHFNAGILDQMVAKAQEGNDIVCASRFIPGGTMQGCPWLKAVLVRSSAFVLHWAARVPTRDPSSGFRLFSRRVIELIPVESTRGFCFSIEFLVKAHRLGWRVAEVPALWFERQEGHSRFKVIQWLPSYLRWFFYAFATTYLRRDASTVSLKTRAGSKPYNL